MIKNTIFFINMSRSYMTGEKKTALQWLRAYIRFMWLSRKD